MALPARATRRVEDRPVIECRNVRILRGIPFFEGEDVSKREPVTSASEELRPMDVRPKLQLLGPGALQMRGDVPRRQQASGTQYALIEHQTVIGDE